MSRISSISRTIRAPAERPHVRQVNQATDIVVVPVSPPRRRAPHKPPTAQIATFSAQLLAGTPRRGLKADLAERARIFATYSRLQSTVAAPGSQARLWV